MTHLPNLIQDLGLILMAAAVVTIIFKKLKQPVVLGYLIAGFLVGPHFTFLPTIKDQANISIWAEIGVIFMLFGLGLEFSFRKLKKVGKSASITATLEILFMLGCGYLVGQFLGWSAMDSLFLGGILSISSTTIIVRAFDELRLKGRGFVSLVFGVLIVEDLIAILLLVLLSSVAVTQTLSGSELIFSALRLGFFLVIWFLLGIYILPAFLRKYRDLMSDETMLIVSIGLCLTMVMIASKVGFSPALGAFVMGSILAETPKGHRIEELIVPVKDLFSAIFFVSVGMLLDPQILFDHFGVILFVTAVTIVGKFMSSAIGALLSGRSLKTSVQTGMSLAQIGEFSFIIATLGMTLKVTSDFLYPVAVAVSALTTFATPYLIRSADPFYHWIEKKLPQSIKNSLLRYESAMATTSEISPLSLVWREYGVKVALNSVVIVAITLAVEHFALPRLDDYFRQNEFYIIAACIVTLIMCAPFLWAVFAGQFASGHLLKEEQVHQLERLQLGIVILRVTVGCLLTGFIVSQFTSVRAISGILIIAVAPVAVILFSRYSGKIYQKIEARFMANMNQQDPSPEKKNRSNELAPWDATMAEFVMSEYSSLVGKTLMEAAIKEKYGVTLVIIERGGKRILAPTREQQLLPYDRLFMIGSEEQLTQIRDVIERKSIDEVEPLAESFGLTPLTLQSTDPFVSKSIRECGLRERVNGLIVGLERDGQRYLNPDSSMVLRPKDMVWIVGDRELIKSLRSPGSK